MMVIPAVIGALGTAATAVGSTIGAVGAAAGSAMAGVGSAIGGSALASGMSYAATGLSAVSGYMQQRAANKASEYNAKMAEQESQDAIRQGQIKEQQQRIQTAQTIGQERAIAAASGVDANSGTPLEQQKTTATFGEFDALTTRYNSQAQANALKTQAAAYRSSEISPILSGLTSGAGTAVNVLGSSPTRKLWNGSYNPVPVR